MLSKASFVRDCCSAFILFLLRFLFSVFIAWVTRFGDFFFSSVVLQGGKSPRDHFRACSRVLRDGMANKGGSLSIGLTGIGRGRSFSASSAASVFHFFFSSVRLVSCVVIANSLPSSGSAAAFLMSWVHCWSSFSTLAFRGIFSRRRFLSRNRRAIFLAKSFLLCSTFVMRHAARHRLTCRETGWAAATDMVWNTNPGKAWP